MQPVLCVFPLGEMGVGSRRPKWQAYILINNVSVSFTVTQSSESNWSPREATSPSHVAFPFSQPLPQPMAHLRPLI